MFNSLILYSQGLIMLYYNMLEKNQHDMHSYTTTKKDTFQLIARGEAECNNRESITVRCCVIVFLFITEWPS